VTPVLGAIGCSIGPRINIARVELNAHVFGVWSRFKEVEMRKHDHAPAISLIACVRRPTMSWKSKHAYARQKTSKKA
jgi:hypothetical protein